MALSQRERLRKQAQKAARRKAVVAEKRKAELNRSATRVADEVRFAAEGPLAACLVSDEIFKIGIGHVVVGRSLPDGDIGAAIFLVDVWCLGVKDSFYREMSDEEFSVFETAGAGGPDYTDIAPGAARQLLHEAVAFARNLGFEPGGEFAALDLIFGDIQASTAPGAFTFGRNGKPFYVAGAQDTPARATAIMRALAARVGSGGFGFLVPTSEAHHATSMVDGPILEHEPAAGELV
jgi:hypothetical protein